jgi:acetyltransferase-like isoleucine patch superfamily enzyme
MMADKCPSFFEKYKDVRTFGRIKIGKQCLIGADTIIMPGVEMQDNCVLGAGSILTTSMPKGSVLQVFRQNLSVL